MIRVILMSIFLLGFFLCEGLNVEITGKVKSIIDGNTIEFISSEDETFKFVLSGIDCPELNQEFGDEAKKHLEKILKGKEVKLIIESKDRLGNRVGSILLEKGPDPRIELLKRGLAWTQERNPQQEFESLRMEAQSKKVGLWGQEDPIPPWNFRRQQSMLSPKMG